MLTSIGIDTRYVEWIWNFFLKRVFKLGKEMMSVLDGLSHESCLYSLLFKNFSSQLHTIADENSLSEMIEIRATFKIECRTNIRCCSSGADKLVIFLDSPTACRLLKTIVRAKLPQFKFWNVNVVWSPGHSSIPISEKVSNSESEVLYCCVCHKWLHPNSKGNKGNGWCHFKSSPGLKTNREWSTRYAT